MYMRNKLKCGVPLTVIVRQNTTKRLWTRCFRGTSIARAGNFSQWGTAEDLFADGLVWEALLAECDDLWQKMDFGTHSLNITHVQLIGWESTAPLANYSSDALEPFDLNRRSHGLRVKQSRTDLLAPRTRELTIVFEFKQERSRPVVVVHSIYPGFDIGELVDDVTEREGRIFFDWSHPGE